MRCARVSCAWRAKPTTLMASTGNTQGIRFSTSPPSSAPSRATSQVPRGAAAGAAAALGAGLLPNCALARSAASRAGDTVAAAASAGQPPSTGSSARQPWPPCASTTGRGSGLPLRWGDRGTRAVHTAPSHAWVYGAAVSITLPVSAKNSSVCPCSAAGSPATRSTSAPSCTRALLLPSLRAGSACGAAWCAAAKAAASTAVVLRSGSCSVKWPSSGMHSLRHTSHEACNCTVTSLASGPGTKAPDTVTGTGNSTCPS